MPQPGAPTKKKRKWVWYALGAGVVLLLIFLVRKKGVATVEPQSLVSPEGGGLGGAGAGGGGEATGGSTVGGTANSLPIPPPTGQNLHGAPLGPGGTREGEESTAGGAIRLSETGGEGKAPGEAGPAGAAASAAVKWSRNAATRKLQQAAIAKGQDPNTVKAPKAKPAAAPAGAKGQARAKPQHGHPAPAAAPAAVKWSRNPAVRVEQQAAIAKGQNPNKVAPPPHKSTKKKK